MIKSQNRRNSRLSYYNLALRTVNNFSINNIELRRKQSHLPPFQLRHNFYSKNDKHHKSSSNNAFQRYEPYRVQFSNFRDLDKRRSDEGFKLKNKNSAKSFLRKNLNKNNLKESYDIFADNNHVINENQEDLDLLKITKWPLDKLDSYEKNVKIDKTDPIEKIEKNEKQEKIDNTEILPLNQINDLKSKHQKECDRSNKEQFNFSLYKYSRFSRKSMCKQKLVNKINLKLDLKDNSSDFYQSPAKTAPDNRQYRCRSRIVNKQLISHDNFIITPIKSLEFS